MGTYEWWCPKCGCLNTLTLKDRTYVCDCGYTEDRDVHASKNVKLFGSTKRTECLEQASAEVSVTTSSIASRLVMQIEPLKRKQEAYSLKGVGSSLWEVVVQELHV